MMLSEKTYVDMLEKIFKANGWETSREVIPDQCKRGGKQVRADLIVYNHYVGYLGIEAKVTNLQQGGVIAKAQKQISEKYSNKTYNGKIIDLWALAIYMSHSKYPFLDNIGANSIETVSQTYANEYGFGWLKGNVHFKSNYLKFIFGTGGAYKLYINTYENDKFDIYETTARMLKKRGYSNMSIEAAKIRLNKTISQRTSLVDFLTPRGSIL